MFMEEQRLEMKVTRDFIDLSAIPSPMEYLKDRAFSKFKNETGSEPAFYCYTFLGNDYDAGHYRLVCFNVVKRFVIVTAPIGKLTKAIEDVKSVNPHLELELSEIAGGTDDFMGLTKTARLDVLNIHVNAH